ncbi:methyltransferase [Bradyrhizobium erythrophlei]|uniref:methyltransferase n=1 Tax=Bradyrhizobium erythrophlei TaxID=1437360 RepID=UPI0035E70151
MSSPAALTLLDLIQSHRITATIYVAAKLGIADLLSSGAKPFDDLAAATGADRCALARLLAALSTIGICERTEHDHYALTATGAALASTARPSFKAWAIFEGEMLSRSWAGMLETIMTGKTAAQLRGFNSSFDMMATAPDQVRIFNAAMADLTGLVTADLLNAYDFGRFSHLMDVGGGSGELIGAVLMRYPQIRGTIFDLARCAADANAHLAELKMTDRANFLAGDFFVSVPGIADVIILKSVIHDWDDERSHAILHNCRQALPARGTLLLVERIMPEALLACDEHKSHALSDLNMLRGPGGQERAEVQYRELLRRAGLRTASITPAGRFAVIEAVPA